MSIRSYVASGGGIRIIGTAAAKYEGERQAKFHHSMFDTFIGTSAGALDVALTANKWPAKKQVDLYLNTELAKFFTPPLIPFELRKTLAANWSIKLDKLANFIDNLGLKSHPGLFVNTVDSETNTHVVYCEKRPTWWQDIEGTVLVENAFEQIGFGKVLTRSMCLPGLQADHPKYKDGGYAENPLLSVMPSDAKVFMISLGYSGDTTWQGGNKFPIRAIDDAMYFVDYKNYYSTRHLIKHYKDIKIIYPCIYDVDSTKFNLSKREKSKIVVEAIANTAPQWQLL